MATAANDCRYDPAADLPCEVDTEQDRVIFIKSIAQFMVCYCDEFTIKNTASLCEHYQNDVHPV